MYGEGSCARHVVNLDLNFESGCKPLAVSNLLGGIGCIPCRVGVAVDLLHVVSKLLDESG